MLRVAVISRWHVHADEYAGNIKNLKDKADITCVWHEDPVLGKKWADSLGVDFEENYDDVLARDDVDGIIVTTPTTSHRDIIVKAANAKKHIFTEKVIATTVKEAEEIKKAVLDNGVKFCISFPQKAMPAFIYAKNAIANGDIGKVTLLRARNGHNGSLANWLPEYWYEKDKAGGGVMIDLGCHPMYLSRWILGEPAEVNSIYSYVTGREVEDNAVTTVRFKNEAIAIVESSFVSPASPYVLEIYGETGTIYIVDYEVSILRRDEKGIERTEIKDLPEKGKGPVEKWVDYCLGTSNDFYGLDEAIQLTELMEAANLSAELGKTIKIQDLKR